MAAELPFTVVGSVKRKIGRIIKAFVTNSGLSGMKLETIFSDLLTSYGY